MKNDAEALKFMFQEIADRAHLLTDWETDFVGNVEDAFHAAGFISDERDKVLNKIYERVTENG